MAVESRALVAKPVCPKPGPIRVVLIVPLALRLAHWFSSFIHSAHG